jgi:hypothetical protein
LRPSDFEGLRATGVEVEDVIMGMYSASYN